MIIKVANIHQFPNLTTDISLKPKMIYNTAPSKIERPRSQESILFNEIENATL